MHRMSAKGQITDIQDYSLTASARESSAGGTERSSARAALRLITSSNAVGCSIGNSPGFAPANSKSNATIGTILGRLDARMLLGRHAAAGDAAPWLGFRSRRESATKRMPNTIE